MNRNVRSQRTSLYQNTSDLELSRLMTAAVVNERFRKMLLQNPDRALSAGFAGESFKITREAQTQIKSIHAKSLSDFAKQLVQIQESALQAFACISGD